MPKKGVKERKWDQNQMKKAIAAVRSGEMGVFLAAKTFEVPKTTLQRMARSGKSVEDLLNTALGRRPVFNKKIEEELLKYILEMEARFFGLTRTDIRSLAFQIARKNGISNPFSILKESAGKDWLYGFLKRHKNVISLRNPTGTSFQRVRGFTEENVQKFYNLLEETYAKHQFSPSRIYNVDETGLSIVQSKQPQVIGRKGKKQIGLMTSAERGSLVTVVTCMSAGGDFIPPFFIFPRKNRCSALMKNAPPSSRAAFHISGWIQLHIFTEWFQHFLKFAKPSVDDPALLILDGHYSHTRNIDVINLARENYVTIISLPPHSTHKMQPLDRTFMGPLKSYYSEEIRKFIRETGRKVTQFEIAELFAKAYIKVQTAQIAANGFKCTGIYPFNQNVFSKEEFLCDSEDASKEKAVAINLEESSQQVCENTQDERSSGTTVPVEPQPGPSWLHISPWDISPPPSTTHRQESRRKQHAKILTASPYKKSLEESQSRILKRRQCSQLKTFPCSEQKKEKEQKRGQKKRQGEPIKKLSVKRIKTAEKISKPAVESSSSDSSRTVKLSDSSEDIFVDIPPSDNIKCIFCKETRTGILKGKWTQCILCDAIWSHEVCIPEKEGFFLCESCKLI